MSISGTICKIPEEKVMESIKKFENKIFTENQVETIYNGVVYLLERQLKRELFAKKAYLGQYGFIDIYPKSEMYKRVENEEMKVARLSWDKVAVEKDGERFYKMENFKIDYFEEGMNNPKIRLKLMF